MITKESLNNKKLWLGGVSENTREVLFNALYKLGWGNSNLVLYYDGIYFWESGGSTAYSDDYDYFCNKDWEEVDINSIINPIWCKEE